VLKCVRSLLGLVEAVTAMAGPDLREICDYLVELAKEGGQIILAAEPSSFDNTSKKNSMVNILSIESILLTFMTGSR
jgi:hypothetical protein